MSVPDAATTTKATTKVVSKKRPGHRHIIPMFFSRTRACDTNTAAPEQLREKQSPRPQTASAVPAFASSLTSDAPDARYCNWEEPTTPDGVHEQLERRSGDSMFSFSADDTVANGEDTLRTMQHLHVEARRLIRTLHRKLDHASEDRDRLHNRVKELEEFAQEAVKMFENMQHQEQDVARKLVKLMATATEGTQHQQQSKSGRRWRGILRRIALCGSGTEQYDEKADVTAAGHPAHEDQPLLFTMPESPFETWPLEDRLKFESMVDDRDDGLQGLARAVQRNTDTLRDNIKELYDIFHHPHRNMSPRDKMARIPPRTI